MAYSLTEKVRKYLVAKGLPDVTVENLQSGGLQISSGKKTRALSGVVNKRKLDQIFEELT